MEGKDYTRDGVGEFLEITKLEPSMTRRGLGVEYWKAYGKLDGLTMILQVWKEDYKLFTDAGYPDLFTKSTAKDNLSIVVVTDKRGSAYRVKSVELREPATPVAIETVLSNEERQRQWLEDVNKFGKPTIISITATFYCERNGAASWRKNTDGTYIRTTREDTRVYCSKAAQS